MKNALIGYSGFVGGTLLKQTSFDALYRSSNIHEIETGVFDLIVCAGAPAQKWIANSKPLEDRNKIEGLIENLKQVKCKTFVLISTVDVFNSPIGVDENTRIVEEGLHPYGLHRRMLEKFALENFKQCLIVRLPGLVGPGLRKNIIFDFLNNNNLDSIESRSIFQFYPIVNLWYDIQIALSNKLQIIHLTAEPINVSDVSNSGFGRPFTQELANTPAEYDMRTNHANLFGVSGEYQYSVRDTLQAIRHYSQSEPIKLKSEAGVPV